jgi:hypothetical protein
MDTAITVYHITGCGDIAFGITRIPSRDEVINPNDIVLPDGSIPKGGDRIICGSCGKALDLGDITAACRKAWYIQDPGSVPMIRYPYNGPTPKELPNASDSKLLVNLRKGDRNQQASSNPVRRWLERIRGY